MCVTHAKHSFPSRCEKHNTIGMDASRCERFNQSSSSSLWENTDSFLSESMSVVLCETEETLELAQRLQNEGLPLSTRANMALRVSPGNYSLLLICANRTAASNRGNCWDTHAWEGTCWDTHIHIHNPDLRKATRREVGESMQILIMRGQFLVLQLIKTTEATRLMRKQGAPVWFPVEAFPLTTWLLIALIKVEMVLCPSTHLQHLSSRWGDP